MEDWHGPDEPGEHLVQNGACDGDAVDVFEIEGVMLIVGDIEAVMLIEAVLEAVTVDVGVRVTVVDGVRVAVAAVPVSVKHSKLPTGHSDVPAA